jgi:hypothetical protein
MKDGITRTSHIAGDLSNRPTRQKKGRGIKVDLLLIPHEGETNQLDSALEFYESSLLKGVKLGPSEVLYHLKDNGCDWDYRKGEGVKLLQRNASNFFKRMMEHAKRINHPVVDLFERTNSYAVAQAPKSKPKSNPKPKSISIPKLAFKSEYSSPEPQISRKSTRKRKIKAAQASTEENEIAEAATILQQLFFARLSTITDRSSRMEIEEEPEDPIAIADREQAEIEHASETLIGLNKIDKPFQRYVNFSLPSHHRGSFYAEVCRELAESNNELHASYKAASEKFDWDAYRLSKKRTGPMFHSGEDFSVLPMNRPIVYDRPKPKPQSKPKVAPKSRATPKPRATAIPRPKAEPKPKKKTVAKPRVKAAPKVKQQIEHILDANSEKVDTRGVLALSQGSRIKGLSRHSPYGTRFSAQMQNGELRESFLAGDLQDRIRSNGKQTALELVLHIGEIDQLEYAWGFVKSQGNIGAGQLLEYLRCVNLDLNHRKMNAPLLQKNAGNFFKRVQEFGKKRELDPTYLSRH